MHAIVDTGTYTSAAALLVHANQDTAAIAEALFDALGEAAASTGTTTGAATWAQAYTTAAEEVTDQLSDLIDALGNTALLLDATSHNHARAQAAAAPYGLPTYALPQRPICSARMTGPPPIYGGNTDQPLGWNIIATYLAGHTWPGADLDRLTALATAWHAAAAGLQTAASWPQAAATALGSMTSPELPTATTTCTRLATITQSLAADCTTLAEAVTAFTTAVQHQRDPIRSIIIDLATTIGLCELGGALTGPLGEWGANTYGLTRITRAAGRIIGLLTGLEETLPHLSPLLTADTTLDTTWLTTLAHIRPVAADLRATNHLLLMNEESAATTGARAGEAAAGATASEALDWANMTDEQVIDTGWADRTKLAKHLRKHADDVGAATEADYVRSAQELLQRARSEGLPTKVAEDGDILVFDPDSKLFAVYRSDGKARTIFRPNNPDLYWEDQRGELQ